MHRRSRYFLLSAGVALIAAATVWLILGRSDPAPPPPPQPVFPGLATRLDELAWIRVSRGVMKVDFAKVAGRWVVIDKDNYPADPDRLHRMLLGLADLTLIEPHAPEPSRLDRIDRDGASAGQPGLIVLRSRTGGTIAEAALATAPTAAPSGGTEAVHVQKPGVEQVSLARGSFEWPADPLEWLDRGIIDLPQTRVASLTLAGAGDATLAVRRDSPDAVFAVAGLPEGMRVRRGAGLSELAGTLAGLALHDVRSLARAEVPEDGLVRAEFVTFDGLAITLRLFTREGADWVVIAASGTAAVEAESRAINDRLARWVYAIPAARATLLRTRLDDLIEPARGL